MRTTIELPDELLARAKSRAGLEGMSLKEFFIEAVAQKLGQKKSRRDPPVLSTGGRPLPDLTPEQLEQAYLGAIDQAGRR